MRDWPLRFRIEVLESRILKKVGPNYIRAHRHASQHRSELEKSSLCGCFYCMEQFLPNEIDEWTDGDQTAMCPLCGIDSVIGSAAGFPISKEFLSRMHKYWFERTISI